MSRLTTKGFTKRPGCMPRPDDPGVHADETAVGVDGRAWPRRRSRNMRSNPMQSPKCGARTRAGHPCKSFVVRDCRRCRMHGARAGAPQGAKNGNFRHGRFTREAAEVSKFFRELVKDAHVLTATTLDAHGLGRKVPAALRRRTHVRKARAKAKAKEQPK